MASQLLQADRLIGASFLFTGAGLVGHIVFSAPLWATVSTAFIAATLFFGTLAAVGKVHGLDLRRRVAAGVVAGIIATVFYDATRILCWKLLDSGAWPFDAFRHFGRGLLGSSPPSAVLLGAGIAFHMLNGILFACVYAVWIGRPLLKWTIAWAFVLESMTLALYPGWLDIARFSEFLQISVVGHLAYGVGLWLVLNRFSESPRTLAHASQPS